jgi:chemotaxis protein MotB
MRRIILLGAFLAATSIIAAGCGAGAKLRAKDAEIVMLQSEIGELRTRVGDLETESEESKALARRLEGELGEISEREAYHLEELDRVTLLRLPDQVLFRFGSARLTEEGKRILSAVGGVLEEYPEYETRIEGHTDSKPIKPEFQDRFQTNWELSTARATEVVRFLISEQHFDPKRLSAAGYGEHRPIADNGSDAGRSQNRRVEFYISKGDLREDLVPQMRMEEPIP